MKKTLLIFSLLIAPFTAQAFDRVYPSMGDEDWEHLIYPYFWIYQIDGTVTVDGETGESDENFGDIFDTESNGLNLRYEAWKKYFGITAEVMWATLFSEVAVDFQSAKYNASYLWTDVAANYRFAEFPWRNSREGSVGISFEGYGGGRLVISSQKLELPNESNKSDNKTWLEPFVGLRTILGMGSKWNIELKGDIGGFGTGSGSEQTINAQTMVNYYMTDGVGLSLGYRVTDLNSEREVGENRTRINNQLSGVTAGITFLFF